MSPSRVDLADKETWLNPATGRLNALDHLQSSDGMNGACKSILTPKATRSTRPTRAWSWKPSKNAGDFTLRLVFATAPIH
jgi:hypothetical protein